MWIYCRSTTKEGCKRDPTIRGHQSAVCSQYNLGQFSIWMDFYSILSFPEFPESNNYQVCLIYFYEYIQTLYLQEELDRQIQFHPCMPSHHQSNNFCRFQFHTSSFFQCLPQHGPCSPMQFVQLCASFFRSEERRVGKECRSR